MKRDRSFPLLLLCFFLSGLAALIYETAWTREFAFVFGTSELAVATVLAAYMGGLAAGAALAGRFAQRIRRPVLAYGLLELGIAASALAVPLGIAVSRWLYVAVFGGQEDLPDAGGLTTSLFYLACSFAILLVPTAMMGATLPLLARHAVREDRELGSRIGVLYAVNTAGAVSGVLIGAFVLLPSVGLRATIAAAAAVNALVFVAAWSLARGAPPREATVAPEGAPARALAGGRASWILVLIGASGFVSFTYEVLWVRLVGHLVGSGTDAFATMLASFLLGIALGAAVASRIASSGRRAAVGFALAQLGIAALSLLAFALVDQIPVYVDRLRMHGAAKAWTDVAACMVTLFPAALCVGATFPFAVRVLARGRDDAGPASARVYSANTVGSIAGSVCAGFFLVPGLGFEGTLTVCVAVNLLLAGLAALLLEPRRPWLVAAAVAGGLALGVAPPARPWHMLRATSMGVNTSAWGPVTYFGVGRSSTVILTDQRLSWGLRTNGLPEAGMPRQNAGLARNALTRWLTGLPVAARPEARSLLLVGLGGAMALEVVPDSIERIDVVELEPEVLAANQSVADLRWRDPLSDPRVHVHLNDARNALLLASRPYDVIVSQPSHPWAGGAAHLYTREFFELVRSRLAPEGVFVQWIGLPFVDEALFRSLLATLCDVFPDVRAYAPPPEGGVLFLASNQPIDMERSVARAVALHPADFALLGIRSPEDVTVNLLLDERGTRELAAGAPLNRDGHNRLQSRSGRLGEDSLYGRMDELVAPVDPLVRALPEGLDVFYLLRRMPPKRGERVAAALPDPLDREVGLALAEMEAGKHVGPRRRLEAVLAQDPRHEEGRAALLRLRAGAIADGRDPEAFLAPPLSDAERALADGWRAREMDPSGAAVRALEQQLAAISFRDPLGADAVRLRIQARIESGDPVAIQQAVELAETSLGDRPDPSSILLRAEAAAAAGDFFSELETLGELVSYLRPGSGASGALALRARSLAEAVPSSPELRVLRARTIQRLGGRVDPFVRGPAKAPTATEEETPTHDPEG